MFRHGNKDMNQNQPYYKIEKKKIQYSVLLLLVILISGCKKKQLEREEFSFHGSVLYCPDSKPIPNAKVVVTALYGSGTLLGPFKEIVGSTTTDGNGFFKINPTIANIFHDNSATFDKRYRIEITGKDYSSNIAEIPYPLLQNLRSSYEVNFKVYLTAFLKINLTSNPLFGNDDKIILSGGTISSNCTKDTFNPWVDNCLRCNYVTTNGRSTNGMEVFGPTNNTFVTFITKADDSLKFTYKVIKNNQVIIEDHQILVCPASKTLELNISY